MINRTTIVVTFVSAALIWLWSVVRTDPVDSTATQLGATLAAGAATQSRSLGETDLALSEETGPLTVPEPEQALSRDLAALASQLDRAKRLADRVGQTAQADALAADFARLKKAVKGRSLPWKDSDRRELHRRTRVLQHEVARFSRELEEVAAVR